MNFLLRPLQYLLKGLGLFFGTLCGASFLIGIYPMKIATIRYVGIPLFLLLLPIPLVFLTICFVTYPIAFLIGGQRLLYFGTRAKFVDEGILLWKKSEKEERTLPWDGIKEVRRLYQPPIHPVEVHLAKDDAVIRIDLFEEDEDRMGSVLKAHGIEFRSKKHAVFPATEKHPPG